MEQFIIYAMCILLGVIATSIIHWLHTTTGTLKIDQSNPEKDVYRLEIDNLDAVAKKKRNHKINIIKLRIRVKIHGLLVFAQNLSIFE